MDYFIEKLTNNAKKYPDKDKYTLKTGLVKWRVPTYECDSICVHYLGGDGGCDLD